MSYYDKSGIPMNNIYKKVAASATTFNISSPSDQVPGRDYVERIIINCPTSTPTNLTLFDGSVTILAWIPPSAITQLNYVFEVGATAITTAGFNVTTGSSVTCTVIGRF